MLKKSAGSRNFGILHDLFPWGFQGIGCLSKAKHPFSMNAFLKGSFEPTHAEARLFSRQVDLALLQKNHYNNLAALPFRHISLLKNTLLILN